MPIEDFFVKLLAQLLLNVTVWLINRVAGSEYAANVIHAVQERAKRLGPARALSSAICSFAKAATGIRLGRIATSTLWLTICMVGIIGFLRFAAMTSAIANDAASLADFDIMVSLFIGLVCVFGLLYLNTLPDTPRQADQAAKFDAPAE
jgi:hypothetical protein